MFSQLDLTDGYLQIEAQRPLPIQASTIRYQMCSRHLSTVYGHHAGGHTRRCRLSGRHHRHRKERFRSSKEPFQCSCSYRRFWIYLKLSESKFLCHRFIIWDSSFNHQSILRSFLGGLNYYGACLRFELHSTNF